MTLQEKVLQLREDVEYHSQLYYNHDAPKISDYEWDKLYHELKKLEDENPELADPHSPTQRIGALNPKVYVTLYPHRPIHL